MSVVGDLVQGVVESALREILRKTTGTGRRARRRKRTLTASERLRRIEKLIKPAKTAGQPPAHGALAVEDTAPRLLIAIGLRTWPTPQ